MYGVIFLQKNRFLVLPFLVGLLLMAYAWYVSYPIIAISATDFLFDHISILYWVSLPLLLVPMFIIALTTKSYILKWMLSIGIVLTFFSIPYFYSMMPTLDAQQFRGFVEYFTQTKSLDASQLNHNYYQWPAFFILADIATSVSGLSLTSYEFLLFFVIGCLLGTALFLYGSKKYVDGGVIVVVAFFISLMYFIDYQAVPFTLGLALLFILFILDARPKSVGVILTILVLYSALLITHLFVPLFFVLYLLIRGLFDKNKQNKALYRSFFLIGLVSYFLVQFSLASFSFNQLVTSIVKAPMGSLSYFVSAATATTVQTSINNIAQLFSRVVTITAVVICVVGLLILFLKRKTNVLDKAILFAGAIYSVLGVVLNTLGYRAVAVAFVPISLGAAFLFNSKFKICFAVVFSVLLALFFFIPLHNSFVTEVSFQTNQNYVADNFFLDHYNWKNPGFVVTDFWTNTYLLPKLDNYQYIYPNFDLPQKVHTVLYTPQFTGINLDNYTTMQDFAQGENLNIVYNDGFSYILTNSYP